MSLRRRLVAGMLLLLVAGIVTTDVVTRTSLRSFLYGRLDEQVDVAQSQAYTYIELTYQRAQQAGNTDVAAHPGQWLAELAVPSSGADLGLGSTSGEPDLLQPAPASGTVPPANASTTAPATTVPATTVPATTVPANRAGSSQPATGTRTGRLSSALLAARISPDVYVEVLDDSGQVLFRRPSGSSDQQDPAPSLPSHLPVRSAPPVHHFGTLHGAYLPDQPSFTAPAQGKAGPYYRGEALAVPGGVLVTAIALAPADQTLSSLTRGEVVVSVVVVLALLLLTLWIVRLGLRPLDEMTTTAGAIAAGDLRRRVRRTDERSEVGRLGAALNGMLSRIEAAMGERTVSEARLRRFVADASHELRTPLTSIRGYAELLRKGALDDEEGRRRAAGRIEEEAARMSTMVDDLLLLARLDQGRPLEHLRLDLAGVVRDAVDVATTSHPEHPVALEVDGPVPVNGDAGRLRQVVDNLLENAAVHTAPGTAVEVRVGVVAGAGEAELVVADRGPGIPSEDRERVFDRFYRGSGARTRPGTGLGLAIVAALAAAHGGSARVDERPGGGAVVVVRLPLAPPEAGGARRDRAPEGGTAAGGHPDATIAPDGAGAAARR